MLQDMDNMEASCILNIKVGMFSQLEESKICLWNVNQMGIVGLTVLHGMIGSISFMEYPGDYSRQTSAHIVSLDQCPIYI